MRTSDKLGTCPSQERGCQDEQTPEEGKKMPEYRNQGISNAKKKVSFQNKNYPFLFLKPEGSCNHSELSSHTSRYPCTHKCSHTHTHSHTHSYTCTVTDLLSPHISSHSRTYLHRRSHSHIHTLTHTLIDAHIVTFTLSHTPS